MSCSRFAALAVLAVLAVLPGCFKFQATVAMNKDGSGTMTIRNTADLAKIELMLSTYRLVRGENAEVPMKDEFDRRMNPDEVRRMLKGKKGIEVVSATRTEDAEKKTATLDLEVKFASLEDWFRCGFEQHMDVQLLRGEGGAWTFKRTAVRPGLDAAGGPDKAAVLKAQYAEALLKPYLKDLEIGLEWRAGVPIVETNGTRSPSGDTVTWSLTVASFLGAKPVTCDMTIREAPQTLRPFHLRIDGAGVATEVPAEATPEPVAPPKEPPKEPAAPGSPR